MSELFEITLQDQIGCARREIKMRERVYADRISRQIMTQEFADHEISVMKAVLETLEQLAHPGDAPSDVEAPAAGSPS